MKSAFINPNESLRTAVVLIIATLVCSHVGANQAAASGEVYSCGTNEFGMTGLGTEVGLTLTATALDKTNLSGNTISQVAAGGRSFSLLLADGGSVFAAGYNGDGATGLGTTIGNTLIATPIDTTNLTGKTISQVSAGDDHSLLLADDGSVFSFGRNNEGQVGLGNGVPVITTIATAIDATNLTDKTITQVAAGDALSLLLADDGTVFSFGNNGDGQTGLGIDNGITYVATPIDTTNLGGKAISQVAAGLDHGLLLADDGTVFSFGWNRWGQTGLGFSSDTATTIATQIDETNLAGKTITKIAAGYFHSLLLADDGTAFSFGWNLWGQTGLGFSVDSATAVATPINGTNLAGLRVIDMSAGGGYSMLLTDDGSVFAFGDNGRGEMGLGNVFGVFAIATPIDTANLSGLRVTGVSTGDVHSLLLTVPEPAAAMLALLAVVPLLFVATRRRGQNALSVVVVVGCSLCCSSTWADHKPGHNPGGGGPGGGELQLVDLHPAGSDSSYAYAISDAGIVVGAVDTVAGPVAGTWDATAELPTFSALPGGAWAYAINEAGAIAGFSSAGSQLQPVYWASPTAEPIDLPLPPGFTRGWANGISSDGVVVGELDDGQEPSAAAAWRVSDGSIFGPVVLGVGGANDVASLASGANRVVGRSGFIGHVATAWDLDLHPDGSFDVTGSTNLVPDGSIRHFQWAEANAITDHGDLTGTISHWNAQQGTGVFQAFVVRDGSLELLRSGGHNLYGVGLDLNDTDVVGATAPRPATNRNATRWDARNKLEDLMPDYFDDSWSTAFAQGISNDGNIVGYGSTGEEWHAWLLRSPPAVLSGAAVPEPSGIFLAAVGLLGAVVRARRTRRGPS